MSLWPVDDEATRQWMTALYDGRLMKKLDTADSLREASLRVLRQWRTKGLSAHPFYWSAFVAAGDWRYRCGASGGCLGSIVVYERWRE